MEVIALKCPYCGKLYDPETQADTHHRHVVRCKKKEESESNKKFMIKLSDELVKVVKNSEDLHEVTVALVRLFSGKLEGPLPEVTVKFTASGNVHMTGAGGLFTSRYDDPYEIRRNLDNVTTAQSRNWQESTLELRGVKSPAIENNKNKYNLDNKASSNRIEAISSGARQHTAKVMKSSGIQAMMDELKVVIAEAQKSLSALNRIQGDIHNRRVNLLEAQTPQIEREFIHEINIA